MGDAGHGKAGHSWAGALEGGGPRAERTPGVGGSQAPPGRSASVSLCDTELKPSVIHQGNILGETELSVPGSL